MVVNSALRIKQKGMRAQNCELKPELMEINIQQINICLYQLRTGSNAVNWIVHTEY